MLTTIHPQQHTTSDARHDVEPPAGDGILLVAMDELAAGDLDAATLERINTQGARVYVIAPATPAAAPRWVVDDGMARHEARQRLHRTLRALQAHGIDARGAVGDPDPIAAIGDVVRQRAIDEVVIATQPKRASRFGWDIASRAHRRFRLPVSRTTEPACPDTAARTAPLLAR